MEMAMWHRVDDGHNDVTLNRCKWRNDGFGDEESVGVVIDEGKDGDMNGGGD